MAQFCIWAANLGILFFDAVLSGSCLKRNFKMARSRQQFERMTFTLSNQVFTKSAQG